MIANGRAVFSLSQSEGPTLSPKRVRAVTCKSIHMKYLPDIGNHLERVVLFSVVALDETPPCFLEGGVSPHGEGASEDVGGENDGTRA